MADSTNNTKFLSSLQFPGSPEYVIDAKYVGGTPAEEFISAINSAMIFKGTLGFTAADNATVTTLPTDARVGDTYKYIGETEPATFGDLKLYKGDIVIYADVPKEGEDDKTVRRWVRVPAGSESEITQLVAGNYIDFFVNGVKTDKLSSNGTIELDYTQLVTDLKNPNTGITLDHKHDVGFTGDHKHTFTGDEKDISVSTLPEGTVKLTKTAGTSADANNADITPAGAVTVDNATAGGNISNKYGYTPTDVTLNGVVTDVAISDHTIPYVESVEAEFKGTQAEITSTGTVTGDVTVKLSETKVNDRYAEYTPSGSISRATFTGTEHDELVVTGALSSVSVDKHTVQHVKDVKVTLDIKKKTVNLGTHTAEGTVTVDEATAEGTVSSKFTGETASVTVRGDISATSGTNKYLTNVEITPSTATVMTGFTPNPVAKDNFVTGITETAYSEETQKVTFGWATASALESISFTPATTNVVSGITATPTSSVVSVAGTATLNGSTDDVVKGAVESTFTGEAHTHDASFSGESFGPIEVEVIDTITPTATVNTKDVEISHNVTTSDSGVKTSKFTPAGLVSEQTFGGDKRYIGADFSNGRATVSGTYTPEGAIDVDAPTNTTAITHTVTPTKGVTVTYDKLTSVASTFTGIAHTHTASFSGTNAYLSAEFTGQADTQVIKYTPTGSISDTTLTFTGETGLAKFKS